MIAGFPLFSIDALIVFVAGTFAGYFFCLLLIAGYESRRRNIGTVAQDLEEYNEQWKQINRVLNIQATKGGAVIGLIVTLILHSN